MCISVLQSIFGTKTINIVCSALCSYFVTDLIEVEKGIRYSDSYQSDGLKFKRIL